jgi:hypothetical protein
MMPEFLEELYSNSGVWADPILIVSGLLFVVGWLMLFIVRMVKRFVYFTLIALILPNGIGIVGYLEEGAALHEAVIERGEQLTDEMEESIEDLSFSPIYLSLAGSVLAAMVGVAGMARASRKKKGAD